MATQPEVKADAGFGPEPQLTVDRPALHADPGGAAQTQVTVRHGGNRVEGFALDVVGLPPAWWRVEPPRLELLPGTSGTAVVEFRPPPGTPAPDAPLPFGVRATSALDATRSVVEEGDLEVGRQLSLTAEIAPLTSRSRWRGRHVLTFSNWGNAPIDLVLNGRDRDGRLAFLFAPSSLKVPIGGTVNARLKARIRRPVLRGKREQIPFQVVATGPGGLPVPGSPAAAAVPGVPVVPVAPGVPAFPGGPVDPGARTLDAVVEQRPVLSNGLLVGLALAALLVVGLAVWLVRLPAVTGAGQRTVEPPTPTGVHMTGFSGGRASLAWKKNDYAWHRVDAFAGKPLPGAKPLQSVPVDPYRYFAVVALENVKPGALYCFQVTALDGDSASAPSTPVCDTTADAPLTPPKVPEPKLVPGGKALVTWNGDPSMTYQVVSTTGEGAPDGGVDTTVKGKSVVEVPVHAGLNCFTVTASKGRQKSRPSDPPSCAPPVDPQQVPSKDGNGNSGTARPSGSPGASPSPSQPSIRKVLDGWVVVLDQLPTAGADPAYQRARAARAVEALKRVGFTEADFQLVTPQKYAAFPEASFVAFAEVVQDQATAMADCQRLQKISAQKNSPFQEFSGCQVPLFVVPKSTP